MFSIIVWYIDCDNERVQVRCSATHRHSNAFITIHEPFVRVCVCVSPGKRNGFLTPPLKLWFLFVYDLNLFSYMGLWQGLWAFFHVLRSLLICTCFFLTKNINSIFFTEKIGFQGNGDWSIYFLSFLYLIHIFFCSGSQTYLTIFSSKVCDRPAEDTVFQICWIYLQGVLCRDIHTTSHPARHPRARP